MCIIYTATDIVVTQLNRKPFLGTVCAFVSATVMINTTKHSHLWNQSYAIALKEPQVLWLQAPRGQLVISDKAGVEARGADGDIAEDGKRRR